MIGNLATNEQDKIITIPSSFQPPKEVCVLTERIKQDYQTGYNILHRTFEEFNDKSLVERMNVDQKSFNAYIQPKSDDPDEKWRWNGVRPITRNKILSIAAHLAFAMIYPGIFAQNDLDDEDRDAEEIMKYLVEWNIKNSDYEMTFLYAVIAALINPVAYIEIDYSEAKQTIKERGKDGKIMKKEILDETLSGLQFNNVPAEEILLANPYEYYFQRQRFIIRRRFIDYDEVKAKYGNHTNFKYIQPGIKAFYNETDGTFYQQDDQNLQTLAEEMIYYNRREDIQVPYVNGIYLGDGNAAANPIKHRDNKNRPRYCYVKFGAEPIDEKRFFFYKSMAFRLINDQDILDQMWRMVMDGTFLEVMTPTAVIGEERFDTDIMFPGSVTNFPKDTKVETIGAGRNLQAGWNAVGQIEKSMTESSQDEQRSGKQGGAGKTAYETAKIEENARINLGIIGKMITRMVKEVGEMMIDRIIMNQTIGEIDEVTGGNVKMKYRSFLLPDQVEGGRTVTRKITFDQSLIGKKMNKKQKLEESYKMLGAEGGEDLKTIIYRANPRLIGRLKYMITIEPEAWMPKNERFETLIKLETYDRLIGNPMVDQEAVTRDFLLKPLTKGEADKYMLKNLPQGAGQMMPGPGRETPPRTPMVGAGKGNQLESLMMGE